MYRHLKAKGVEILRTRENTHSVGVYFNDPDGNGLEVYDEEPRGYRRAWEGQYSRRLEEVTASASRALQPPLDHSE